MYPYFIIVLTILFNTAFIGVLAGFTYADTWVQNSVFCICIIGLLFEIILLIAFCLNYYSIFIIVWHIYSLSEIIAASIVLGLVPETSKLLYLEFFAPYVVLKVFRIFTSFYDWLT